MSNDHRLMYILLAVFCLGAMIILSALLIIFLEVFGDLMALEMGLLLIVYFLSLATDLVLNIQPGQLYRFTTKVAMKRMLPYLAVCFCLTYAKIFTGPHVLLSLPVIILGSLLILRQLTSIFRHGIWLSRTEAHSGT